MRKRIGPYKPRKHRSLPIGEKINKKKCFVCKKEYTFKSPVSLYCSKECKRKITLSRKKSSYRLVPDFRFKYIMSNVMPRFENENTRKKYALYMKKYKRTNK